MLNVADVNHNKIVEENETMHYLEINIRNNNPKFQIIQNGQSFTIETCWAGIGGFVGIFIGVSLRQMPKLFLNFLHFVKRMMN